MEEEDKFRISFKYFKSKNTPPDLSKVIDPSKIKQDNKYNIENSIQEYDKDVWSDLGLISPASWEVHNISGHPGLFLIKNPFTFAGQLLWMQQCICSFPRSTKYSNLEAHNISLENQSWWNLVNSRDGTAKKEMINQLRWVTLGYHHNWNTKVYSDYDQSEVPTIMKELCNIFSHYLGFHDYKAEAIILNYYHRGSTLAPHQDHSEPYMEAPLFSFSFGETAIFLIGGESKSVCPTPIFLQSGDVMVMTAESRRAFHAVPKIMSCGTKFHSATVKDVMNEVKYSNMMNNPIIKNEYKNNLQEYLKIGKNKNEIDFWESILDYCSQNRININIRQVLRPGQDRLPSSYCNRFLQNE